MGAARSRPSARSQSSRLSVRAIAQDHANAVRSACSNSARCRYNELRPDDACVGVRKVGRKSRWFLIASGKLPLLVHAVRVDGPRTVRAEAILLPRSGFVTVAQGWQMRAPRALAYPGSLVQPFCRPSNTPLPSGGIMPRPKSSADCFGLGHGPTEHNGFRSAGPPPTFVPRVASTVRYRSR